jgi:hypothetical protein
LPRSSRYWRVSKRASTLHACAQSSRTPGREGASPPVLVFETSSRLMRTFPFAARVGEPFKAKTLAGRETFWHLILLRYSGQAQCRAAKRGRRSDYFSKWRRFGCGFPVNKWFSCSANHSIERSRRPERSPRRVASLLREGSDHELLARTCSSRGESHKSWSCPKTRKAGRGSARVPGKPRAPWRCRRPHRHPLQRAHSKPLSSAGAFSAKAPMTRPPTWSSA